MKKTAVAILALGASMMAFAEANLEAGKEKAETLCMACHGAGGVSPNPIWPSLAGQSAKYTLKQLQDFKSGARSNAVMGAQAAMLSDQEMENVSAYYASLALPPAATQGRGDAPEEMLAEGQALYRGGDLARGIPACSACHGPTGAGIPPAAFPALSGQQAEYNRMQLQHFQHAANVDQQASDSALAADEMRANDPNEMMRDVARKLTPRQIEAVSLYIQGLN